jgi:deoxyribonuclease-4
LGLKYIGAHVSISGGVENAPLNAAKIGAKAFAMFVKNQRRWHAKPLSEKDIANFQANLKKYNFSAEHVLPHDGYLINLAHPEKEKRKKSLDAFIDEVERVHQLGLKMLNFHPGTTLGKVSEDDGLKIVAESVNEAIHKTKKVVLVIETTAGQGNHLGYRFEHLARIIELTDDKNRIGVCLDTCHIFAAGYDIRDKETYERTMKEFDEVVGFSYLKGVHLNDAMSKFGSRVDRHHNLGKGNIGIEFFQMLMQDKRFDDIPIILETIDDSLWKEEIELLYSFC